jgi:bifunctional UDP-N-acetylglucosamine pyrophosphorylase/glucosamine-1-phosphate N-acetyltransferase
MSRWKSAAVVLAAGKGTRMKSARPKVLHSVANRPMILHILDRLKEVDVDRTIVVVGAEQTDVAEAVAPALTAVQSPPRGTGDAVLAARTHIDGFDGDVLILCGDTPLLTAATLSRLLDRRRAKDAPAVVLLGFRPADTAEYGRLVVGRDGSLDAIVEHMDATAAQRAIPLCNSGVMAVDGRHLCSLLDAVGNDNDKGEYYLTDIVAIARKRGLACAVVEGEDPDEIMGVNSRIDLAAAEAAMQRRLRAKAMAEGATLADPETVYFSADTRLGQDVTVGPHVVFGPGVSVGNNVEIVAFCHLTGVEIAEKAIVGPFARIRPGTRIGPEVRIGNFVEVKGSVLEKGAKANHLSYVGDTHVGAGANIGAGTITCNYDGFFKSKTEIGAGAFIGSNTALVAPVKVGDGAIVGAGSVITIDVKPNALAVERNQQVEREGWATQFRARKKAQKEAAKAATKASEGKSGEGKRTTKVG